MSDERKKIGIVAIGRNEGERLVRCLDSFSRDMPAVYVDSGSSDGSVEHARNLAIEVVELDMRMPFTAARARNEGARQLLAAYPYLSFIQFVDGDCELEEGWLHHASTFLDHNPDYAVVCGRRRERHPEASIYNRMCDEEWNTPIGDALAAGGDAMYRVAAFMALEGFDPAMVAGEEPELCHRLSRRGWKIRRLDAPMTIHDAAMHKSSQWWMRTVRCGFGYAQAWHKTWRSGQGMPIYGRQVLSAIFWTFGIVAFGLLLALWLGPIGLFAVPIFWGVQLARLTLRFGWQKGSHLLAGKLAEALGIIRFVTTLLSRRNQGAILYK